MSCVEPGAFGRVALAYAERGFRVFPCAGKVPLIKNGRGCHDATTDYAAIREWNADPRVRAANLGIATGRGIHVIDVDKGGEPVIWGLNLPQTLTARTGSGGWHYYFRTHLELPNTASKIGPHVDSRGDGGYVIGPPSLHPETQQPYRWWRRMPMAELPANVVALILPPPPPPRKPLERQPASGYADTALASEVLAVVQAKEGTRNHTLNRAAYNVGQIVGAGLLSEERARAELEGAAALAGLKAFEIKQTIASGLRAGIANPRQVRSGGAHA